MKNIIICTLSAVCLLINLPCANAQEPATGISIRNARTEIAGENLNIIFDLTASGLELKSDEQFTLEFALESDDQRLVLPSVVYSGKLRSRYEQRRELLADSYKTASYATYSGVEKSRTYRTNYTINIPYAPWMEHAALIFRGYTYDCQGNTQTSNGLISSLNPAPVYVEPEIWRPNPAIYPSLVSFLTPEVEEVKARASMIELKIGFPVNVTEIRSDFGDNRRELTRADSLVWALQNNDLVDIRGVHIRGYASPEGSYAANERLARGRSQGFKQYMIGKYPNNTYVRNARTSWVPEDWEGFGQMVESSDLPRKWEIQAIVNDPQVAPDTKDKMLQKVPGWSANYKVILNELYPKLRRIELTVDYTVRNLSDSQARELLYTNPEMLSLDEIYRVARYYAPGSQQYRAVYEIAARQYPNDVIANNNAAAALLREGKAESALPYLEKIADRPESLINFGTYHYIMGDPERASEYFSRAQAAGISQGDQNHQLINAR